MVAPVATGALLLYLGRSLTFWYDEWRSITFDGGFVDYLRPVNEHWSTFPLALYRATFELVELRSYLPYLAQVIVLHLVAVAALTCSCAAVSARSLPRCSRCRCSFSEPERRICSGRSRPGSSDQSRSESGRWCSSSAGQTVRGFAASGLLIVSLMASGIGLFFVVAVAGRTAFDPHFGLRLAVVAAP